MRILHVGPLYYPSVGGNQQHLQILSEKLASLQENVTVFTSDATELHQLTTWDPEQRALKSQETLGGVLVFSCPG